LDDYPGVEAQVVEWIGESISIYKEPEEKGPRVVILVGPTGVGKTTTIAKLAAM
jgi:flagellar biosynthesis protein FlhF